MKIQLKIHPYSRHICLRSIRGTWDAKGIYDGIPPPQGMTNEIPHKWCHSLNAFAWAMNTLLRMRTPEEKTNCVTFRALLPCDVVKLLWSLWSNNLYPSDVSSSWRKQISGCLNFILIQKIQWRFCDEFSVGFLNKENRSDALKNIMLPRFSTESLFYVDYFLHFR